jgi:hypothetical protein
MCACACSLDETTAIEGMLWLKGVESHEKLRLAALEASTPY